MPRFELAPTRTNLLRLKGDLSFALEGYELLDQKREILMTELRRYTDRAIEVQRAADEELAHAFHALAKALEATGVVGVYSAARAVNIETTLTVGQRRVMGVAIPSVELILTETPPYYGPSMTSAWTDEAVSRFRNALTAIAELAETRITVSRLARELEKTMRRVNALEKIFIPEYRETKEFVEQALEESDRNALSILRRVKERLADKPQ